MSKRKKAKKEEDERQCDLVVYVCVTIRENSFCDFSHYEFYCVVYRLSREKTVSNSGSSSNKRQCLIIQNDRRIPTHKKDWWRRTFASQVEKCDSINFIIKINFETDLTDMLTCKSRTFIRSKLSGARNFIVIHRRGSGLMCTRDNVRSTLGETREIVAYKSQKRRKKKSARCSSTLDDIEMHFHFRGRQNNISVPRVDWIWKRCVCGRSISARILYRKSMDSFHFEVKEEEKAHAKIIHS